MTDLCPYCHQPLPEFILTPDDPNQKNGRDYIQEAHEVISFLNERTQQRFRVLSTDGKPTANTRMVIARLKSGITVQDCKTVIARKIRDWSNPRNGQDFSEYLRPKTLFAESNFESYLGKCVPGKVK